MIYLVQKIIVGALPLALSFIAFEVIAGRLTIKASVYLSFAFVVGSFFVGHIMTLWTSIYRSIKHSRGI